MRILLATRNDHKVREIVAILAGTGIDVTDLRAFPDLGELPETHETFAENAVEKARFVFEHTGLLTVADDSGIEVDALGGRPGVHSKRFSPEGTDEANNTLLLHLLEGREPRTARYRCVIAAVGPGLQATVEGRCEGVIGFAYRGAGGFGYDPLFLPIETPGRTMAELTMDDKNAISHRGRAVRQLPALLGRSLGS
jgi:XTP/dITP diphosphohydrolase